LPPITLLAAPATGAEIDALAPANLDAFALSVFDADGKRLLPPTRMQVHRMLHVADIMPTLFLVCPFALCYSG
jgi:hypothetical protein